MMDPMVAQKLIEMAANINQLNIQMAQLAAQVAALNDAASAQARHWNRSQAGQMQEAPIGAPGPQMGQGPQC